MPIHKDFKRLVRGRMQKTGESYTAARAQLLQREPGTPVRRARASGPGPVASPVAVSTPLPPAAPASDGRDGRATADHATLAGMSDATIRARTGRTWREWVAVLDARDAHTWPHGQIARHVNEDHGIDGWWSQSVTVGYERIKGLREKGQRRGGAYETSKSRTFPVAVTSLYEAFTKPRMRAKWLPGVKLTVRKATPRSIRITWEDATSVEVWLTAKAPDKGVLQIQHSKLPDRAAASRMKEYWSERLDDLQRVLAP
jgi:uncharacterized protein YndB with AHSA1/START domain